MRQRSDSAVSALPLTAVFQFFIVGVLLASTEMTAGPPTVATHCTSNEMIWFNGWVPDDSMTVSVCGAEQADEDTRLQLRIGTPGAAVEQCSRRRQNVLADFWFNNETRLNVAAYALDYHGTGPCIILRKSFDAHASPQSRATVSFREDHVGWREFVVTPNAKPLALMAFETLIAQPPFE